MPYGIPNEKPEQTKWMERCVDGVMGGNDGMEKSRAIAICKANLKKHNWKVPKESESETSLWEEMNKFEKKLREAFMGPMNDTVSPSGPWIEDIYDTYAIVRKGDSCWKVPYTMDGETVTVNWEKAIKVERKTVWDEVSGEAEEAKTKVPPIIKRDGGRVITYGYRTIG